MANANEMANVEVWILIDGNGDYVVHKDSDALQAAYDEDVAETDVSLRRIKVTLAVPLPKPIELSALVPEEGSAVGELKVA